MLTIEQMIAIDPALAKLREEELLELRSTLYGFAQLAFESYYTKKHGSKCPVGVFPPTRVESNI